MRKLMVGMLTVGLLAAAAPAMAQSDGSGDPLGLVASGAVLPYVGNGAVDPGSVSFLEVYAPNESPSSVHMFFFDVNCTRQGDSVGLPVSENDIELLPLTPDFIGATSPADGLITLAGVDGTGFNLVPLDAPLHLKVLQLNGSTNMLRTLEPIALSSFDVPAGSGLNKVNPLLPQAGGLTWSPLRTGATFFAITEGISTQIYFVCPTTNIQSKSLTSLASAFPIASGFPIFETRFASTTDFDGFQTAGATTPLRMRVFDDEETFLRDVTTSCNCLTKRDVTAISSVFKSPLAPFGTYTEVEGGVSTALVCSTSLTDVVPASTSNPCACADDACVTSGGTAGFKFRLIQDKHLSAFAFTGYRAITFGSGTGQLSLFSRLQNGNRCELLNSKDRAKPTSNCTPPPDR